MIDFRKYLIALLTQRICSKVYTWTKW